MTEYDLNEIKKIELNKYSTWEWNYGFSPEYNVKKERRLDCGNVTIYLMVDKGIIK